MPQPITSLVAAPHIVIDSKVLCDKPQMAALVTQIFALWALLERELGVLLIRLLGAEAVPSHAIFAVLQTQSLQEKAIVAAARSVMPPDEFAIFSAVMDVVGGVKKTRNKLAHWNWARCEGHPELLLLGDPRRLKQRDERIAAFFQGLDESDGVNLLETWTLIQFDEDAFLAYRASDLEREVRDLTEADRLMFLYGIYLDPSFSVAQAKNLAGPAVTRQDVRERMLQDMLEMRLFKDALDRVKSRVQST